LTDDFEDDIMEQERNNNDTIWGNRNMWGIYRV
jgi:hypothetical protein